MLTIIIIIIYICLLRAFIRYNYNNLALQYASDTSILIDNALVDRLRFIKLKQGNSLKKNKMAYGGPEYLYNESDLIWTYCIFFIIQLGIFFLIYRFILIDRLDFQIILNGIIIFFFNIILGMEILHCYLRKETRRPIDAVIVLMGLVLTSVKKNSGKGNIFLGKLVFVNDSLVTIVTSKKREPDLRIYPLRDISNVVCQYKEKTIITTITVKDGIYESEFSKFIFESDQVEKDYFEALYEFPFMERSTVYDFEKLHHDIMQDLVDEERTFFFKDYLIKEEAS